MKIKNYVLTNVLEEFEAGSTVVKNTESYAEENRSYSVQR
jgi:hypothetical protein